MKRLISLLSIIVLLGLPGSAFASHLVVLSSPINGAKIIEDRPSFYFDYECGVANDYAVIEVATRPDVGSDGKFYSENVVIWDLVNYPQKWYKSSSTKLKSGTYYWHISHSGSCGDSVDYHTVFSSMWSFKKLTKTRVSKSSHKKCKDKKYHAKHCKTIKKHQKKCTKVIYK